MKNAFPFTEYNQDGTVYNTEPGMTLRDYFAAAILQGVVTFNANEIGPEECDEVAAICYRMADAMLRAREAK